MSLTEKLGPSCPTGGRFYVCEKTPTRFIGCCTVNPCERQGDCPAGNLTSTTFNADSFEDIPPQNCTGWAGTSNWYTCKKSSPPFMGCCASNPCSAGGCPSSRLIAAKLSSNATNAAVFLPRPSSTPPPTASPSASPSPSPSPSPSRQSLHPGAIAGIAVGGALVLGLIALLIWRRRRRNDRESHIIAEFPARYIAGALPDMGQAHGKDDSSRRSAYSPDFYSPVTKPRPSLAASSRASSGRSSPTWRPPADSLSTTQPTSAGLLSSRHVSVLSSTDWHGRYSRVSVMDADRGPETSRFEDPDSVGAARHGLEASPPGISEARQWKPYRPS